MYPPLHFLVPSTLSTLYSTLPLSTLLFCGPSLYLLINLLVSLLIVCMYYIYVYIYIYIIFICVYKLLCYIFFLYYTSFKGRFTTMLGYSLFYGYILYPSFATRPPKINALFRGHKNALFSWPGCEANTTLVWLILARL